MRTKENLEKLLIQEIEKGFSGSCKGNKETIFEIDFTSRWCGSYKHLTKDCNKCGYFKEIKKIKFCLYGKAWKILGEIKNTKKCQYYTDKK